MENISINKTVLALRRVGLDPQGWSIRPHLGYELFSHFELKKLLHTYHQAICINHKSNNPAWLRNKTDDFTEDLKSRLPAIQAAHNDIDLQNNSKY